LLGSALGNTDLVEPPVDRAPEGEERPFVAVARDPAGVTYHVNASVQYGPGRRPVFAVTVMRDDPTGRTIVADFEHRHMSEARERAQAQVHAIKQGTFAPQATGDWGLVVTGCVALAIAVGGWVATGKTSGVLRIVCGLATLAAGGYVVYLLGLLLMMVVVIRFFDRGMAEDARIPWFVWVVIPVLVVSWALWSWLAGYDAEQWLWTATSMAVFSVGIVLAFFRR
jgi:hypothetical protein